MSDQDFAHLHSHSSASDGLSRVEDILTHCASLGFPGHAIVDHGVSAGCFTAWREAPKIAAKFGRAFKAVGGIEVYMVEDRFNPPKRAARKSVAGIAAEDDENAGLEGERTMPKRFHLTLLCATETGFRNMMEIVRASNESGVTGGWGRRIPLCDLTLLEQFHEGLICLSGCVSAPIAALVLNGKRDEAFQYSRRLHQIFGEDYYVECMPSSYKDQRPVNRFCLEMAEDMKLPLVATNDCHWVTQEDWLTHEVLCAIQTKGLMSDRPRSEGGRRFCLEDRCYWIRTREEMIEAFQTEHGDYISGSLAQSALDRSLEILDKVTFTGPKFAPSLPHREIDPERLADFKVWRERHGVAQKGIYHGNE